MHILTSRLKFPGDWFGHYDIAAILCSLHGSDRLVYVLSQQHPETTTTQSVNACLPSNDCLYHAPCSQHLLRNAHDIIQETLIEINYDKK